jgi:hypothetical protein
VLSRTFLLDRPAPLDDMTRRRLRSNLHMTRDLLAEHLGADDREHLDRLVADTGPESVLHRPDVFMLRASTVHTGVRG